MTEKPHPAEHHLDLPPGVDPAVVQSGDFGPHDHPVLGFDAAPEWLGYTVDAYGGGFARAHMTVRDDMLNGYEIAHGGIVFAFADTCFAWACNSSLQDEDTVVVSSGADIDFVSTPRKGTRLTAVGLLRAAYGRSGICDVTVSDEKGALVAEYRGRGRRVPRPK